MAIRSEKSTSIDWQRDHLFVRDKPFSLQCPVRMGACHDTDSLRGMLAIKIGFLFATISAMQALVGE